MRVVLCVYGVSVWRVDCVSNVSVQSHICSVYICVYVYMYVYVVTMIIYMYDLVVCIGVFD